MIPISEIEKVITDLESKKEKPPILLHERAWNNAISMCIERLKELLPK